MAVDCSSVDTTYADVTSVVDLSLVFIVDIMTDFDWYVLSLVFIVDIMIDVSWYVVSMDSDVDWSLEASNEDVGVFIWVEDVISVDIPVEYILYEGVDCATVNKEFEFLKKFWGK